jgi:hypothetical protein
VIKVEGDASVQSEKGSTDIETDEVCVPSVFSIHKAEPQVILSFG